MQTAWTDVFRTAYGAVDPDVRLHVADSLLAGPTLIGSRDTLVVRLADDGHRPLVCVHGLGGHPQNFLPLRALMWMRDRRRVYAFGYDESLDAAAEKLASTLEAIALANELAPDAKFDIVAHSMGGLVVRLAMLDPRVAARVHTVVTLATPHHGTLTARFLSTPRALDLRPGSPILERIAGQVPWKNSRLIAFWSPSDVLMLPATTATVEGADNRELGGVSHNGFLVRPRVLKEVERALIVSKRVETRDLTLDEA